MNIFFLFFLLQNVSFVWLFFFLNPFFAIPFIVFIISFVIQLNTKSEGGKKKQKTLWKLLKQIDKVNDNRKLKKIPKTIKEWSRKTAKDIYRRNEINSVMCCFRHLIRNPSGKSLNCKYTRTQFFPKHIQIQHTSLNTACFVEIKYSRKLQVESNKQWKKEKKELWRRHFIIESEEGFSFNNSFQFT